MIFSEYYIKGETTEVTICPIGDIQWNGERRDIAFDHLQDHIKFCLQQPKPLFIGTGDYIDFVSPSNREKIAAAQFYDGPKKKIDDVALHLLKEVDELILRPTKDLWLGAVAGHHYYDLPTGGNSDMELCRRLKIPYYGEGVGICRLTFLKDSGHKQSIQIWFAHGKGWGKSAVRPAVLLEEISSSYENIDIYLMGHHTKKVKADKDRMYPIYSTRAEPRLGHRTIHLVGTGGWQKGYVEGTPKRLVKPTYVERALYGPVALGAPIIHVRPKWRRSQSAGTTIWEPNITVEV